MNEAFDAPVGRILTKSHRILTGGKKGALGSACENGDNQGTVKSEAADEAEDEEYQCGAGAGIARVW